MEEIEKLFKPAIDEIERLLKTKNVVGEPMVIDGRTVIPLVSLGFGFGAGGGVGKAPKAKDEKAVEGWGGGTGGGGGMKPVGIIVVDEQGVHFDPVKSGGSVLEKVLGTIAHTRGKKEPGEEE